MRMLTATLAAALTLSAALEAQIADTLHVGDRVRVNVAASRSYTNVFVGNVASISADTLVLELPGNKGTIILPRLAIAEIAVPNGRESRWKRAAIMTPLIVPPLVLASLPSNRSSSNKARYVMAAALTSIPVVSLFTRTPPERWRPVYGWLYGRTP